MSIPTGIFRSVSVFSVSVDTLGLDCEDDGHLADLGADGFVCVDFLRIVFCAGLGGIFDDESVFGPRQNHVAAATPMTIIKANRVRPRPALGF